MIDWIKRLFAKPALENDAFFDAIYDYMERPGTFLITPADLAQYVEGGSKLRYMIDLLTVRMKMSTKTPQSKRDGHDD